MSDTGAVPPNSGTFTQELEALSSVLNALNPLSEEGRMFVFRTAGERLKIPAVVPDRQPSHSVALAHGVGAATDGESLKGATPKDFLRQKKPTSELQRMVCLAFYLAHVRDKPHFKTADLTTLNTEAAGERFSNASATLNNATYQSHFFAPAGKGGLKQLTTRGEDFVRALPDQTAAKAASSAHRAPRRKTKKAKERGKKE